MKTSFTFLSITIAIIICSSAKAQNVFPSTGRAGIYTTSPAASLQVRGGARIGTTASYVNIDSATGNLSFVGTSAYRVAGNRYAFQYSGNTNYGLFFNSTNVQYEFRNGSAVPVFSINANTGNSVFNGTLKVGAYTLPATDGTNGQVLKTNGAGVLKWSNDNGGSGSGWSLTGNAGTNANTNFLGTTDAQPLVFKVNNSKAGYIDYDIAKANTAFGYQSLNSNTGGYNTAFGYNALKVNTTGNNNTADGYGALASNNTGYNNTAFGSFTLSYNTTGINNTSLGNGALHANSTGNDNTASGYFTLYTNTTGGQNSAYGEAALNRNTTGNGNTANGFASLYLNTTGHSNVAVGVAALFSNTDRSNLVAVGDSTLYNNGTGAVYSYEATENTAIGSKALYSNTTGSVNTANGAGALYKNTTGSGNIGIGRNALYSNTKGGENTAIGYAAMQFNDSGGANIAIGSFSMNNNTSGSSNVAIGSNAFLLNETGSFNTAIGPQAMQGSSDLGDYNTALGVGSGTSFLVAKLTNTTALGAAAFTTADNQVRIGSFEVTSIGGYTNWTNISDGRVKKNIKQNVPGLAFINKVKPITYNLDLDAADKIVHRPEIKDKNGKAIQVLPDQSTSRKAKQSVLYTGFVAQDVEKAAKSLNYDFSGVDAAKNEHDLYGLRYAEFVVPLVKAVQELSKMNDDKDEKISDLQKQIDELKAMITGTHPETSKQQSAIINGASLEQNIPNPFANETTINYTLPQTNAVAQIIIRDKTGKTLKAINVSGSGKGSVKVDAATLASGAYSYSLVVNGKLIGTKEMILAK